MPKKKEQQKQKEGALVVEGIVVEAVKGKFRVQMLTETGQGDHIVLAHLAGKLRKNFIKIVPGDQVRMEVTPYDLTRGRIVYRTKG